MDAKAYCNTCGETVDVTGATYSGMEPYQVVSRGAATLGVAASDDKDTHFECAACLAREEARRMNRLYRHVARRGVRS